MAQRLPSLKNLAGAPTVSKVLRLSLIAAALALLYSFRLSLLDQGYGAAPEPRAAANLLSLSLAAATLIAYRYSSQGLAAVGAAYVLLEVTLLREPSIARAVSFALATFILARMREGVPLGGFKGLAASIAFYAAGSATALIVAAAVLAYIEAPLALLSGDAATFYAFISTTRAWKYIAFLAALAALTRVIASASELAIALKWRRSYAAMQLARTANLMISELRSPLSKHENLSLWLAATMLALLTATLVYEAYRVSASLGEAALIALLASAGSIAAKISMSRLMAGSFRAFTILSLAIALAVALAAGPGALLEAVGLEAEYRDPLAPLAGPLVGVQVEERLSQASDLAKIVVRLLWGG